MAAPAPSMPTGPKLGAKLKPKPASEPAPAPSVPTVPIVPAKLPTAPLKPAAHEDTGAPQVDKQEELAKKAIWAAAGVFGLLIIYMIAGRLVAVVTRWPAPIFEPVAASHCTQFIDLAKLAYGENWRVRLDPRDTTCDQQVKAEWEHQQLTRYVPPVVPLSAPAALTPAVAPVVRATEAALSEHCLNVISLAKTKFGAEWKSKLSADEAACAVDSSGAKPPAASVPASDAVSTPVDPAPQADPAAAAPGDTAAQPETAPR